MNAQSLRFTPSGSGRVTVDGLRQRARHIAARNLPRAADATESAGKAMADFALSTSHSLAKSLRAVKLETKRRRGLPTLLDVPLLRAAGRFAMRNPALVAGAGLAIAALGYAALRGSEEPAEMEYAEE